MVRQAVRGLTTAWRPQVADLRQVATWRRLAPAGLVGAAIVFHLMVLNPETTEVPNLNDGSLHIALIRTALHNLDQGRLPFGAWFPYLSLGSAQFLHYQTFPHVLAALVAAVVGPANVYYWSLYLLLALWPVSVYLGARLLGWDRWIAACAALVAPFLVNVAGYGYQDTSYTWNGFGVWTQLWGMWLLPLAWGLSWRAVNLGKNYALAALAIALTIACHFLTGYLALLVLVPWVLADWSQLRRRLIRAGVVFAGALLIASAALIPLIAETGWSGNLEFYKGTFYFDSYGAPQVLGWLFTGQLYDSGRFPIVSLLVGVGLIVCGTRLRRDARARALIAAWTLSLVLYFGRPTLGPVLNILPGSSDLPLHRYINGVHLAGLMLAGVGAMWLVRRLLREAHRVLPRVPAAAAATGIALAGVAALYPAWSQIATYAATGADEMSAQQQADATDGADLAVLIDQIKAAGDGRAYAGTKANWGHEYTVGSRPVYIELENADVDAIGMWLNTESLSSDVEAQFDETNPANYDLFNIRYLILPSDHASPVKADLLARSGRHTLWRVATSGYLEVVDTVAPPLVADRTNIGPQSAAFMASAGLQQHQFPTVAFNGAQAAAPTLTGGAKPQTAAGAVGTQSASLADGSFSGQVTANRSAVVLLKSTYEPGWRVSVDGTAASPIMVAPSFVGVAVSPGQHSVTFRFATYPFYAELLALSLLTFVAMVVLPRHFATRVTVADTEPIRDAVGAGPAERPQTWAAAQRLIGRWRAPRNTRRTPALLGLAVVLMLVIAGVVNLIASQPDAVQATAYVNAGLTAQSQGRINDAREDYRQALAHDPRSKFAYFDLGTIEEEQNNNDLAIRDYEAALESDGSFVPALYNLAILVTQSDPNEAVRLYQRAIQAQPTDATSHLNLGFLLHSLGRDAEAMTEFAAAVRLDPNLASRIPPALRPPQS